MNKKLYLVVGVVVIFLLMGAGCAKDPVAQTPALEGMVTTNQPAPAKSEQPAVAQKSAETAAPPAQPKNIAVAADCSAFPDKLNACSKYKCQFVHLLTKETLQKEVAGIVSGKCKYIEQMPNGGKMECNYTESARKVAAEYYKNVAAAESTGTSVSLDLDGGEQKATYTIDGQEVENPLQVFLTDGTCVISGY
ncbi:MAG: hypothetical protein WCT37_00560 [Patescibacteria group bacterium]|jgi:hypothetical protein